MAIYRFQVTIPYFTNVPTDVIQNDFHLSWPVGTPVDANYEDVRDALVDFYDTIYSSDGAGDRMAPWVVPANVSLKVYNVQDTPPRAPHFMSDMPLADNRVVTTPTPPEVAVCASFQGVQISGIPQARRRGRVFIGGLANPETLGTSSSFPLVDSELQDAISTACQAFATATAADGWVWVVYSRVALAGAPVNNGWIDNALDTQRRRGQAPTARVTWG